MRHPSIARRVTSELLVALMVLLALTALVEEAVGNGRFPSSTSITTRPGKPSEIYLGVTFGLLISQDQGASFRWLCENAVGYGGTFDPKYRVAANGTIYATNFDGLRISRDRGCSFEFATMATPSNSPGAVFDKWVDAIDVAPNGDVWIGTADGGKFNDVYRSLDQAETFSPMGLSSNQVWYKSIVMGHDQSRLYVSGYQVTTMDPQCTDPDPEVCPPIPPRVRLYRTDNPSAIKPTWVELSTTGIPFASTPLFLFDAVHPANPQIVYGRSIGANNGGDILLRSEDSGETWTQVFSLPEPIRAVAIRPSGEVFIGTFSKGMYAASDGVNFAALENSPSAACLGVANDGSVLACGANWEPNFFALASTQTGTTWQTLLRFSQIKGPLQCPVGTVAHDTCETMLWPQIREQFGITQPPDATAPSPPPPPPTTTIKGCCDGAPAAASCLLAIAVGAYLALKRRLN